MAENEYISRLKSVSNEIVAMRNQSGSTSTTVTFGTLALLKAKNKISDKDLDIIFEVEKQGMTSTLDDYFSKNYGDSSFPVKNEQELEDVRKYCNEYVDNMKNFVISAAQEINPPKKKKEE